MGFARWQIALVILVTSVLAPAGILVWLLLTPVRSQAEIAAAVTVSLVWMLVLALDNWWEFTSVYLRLMWLGVLVPVAGIRLAGWPDWPHWGGLTWQLALALVVTAVGVWVLALSLGGGQPDGGLPMAFPLAGGRYLVTDGGDGKRAPFRNYHYGFGTHRSSGVSASMRYATDIVAVGPLGGSSRGFLPTANSDFLIWDRAVLSPVAGEIVHVVNDVADNEAFGSNRPYGVGNHVVVRTGSNVYVVIGHLRDGSIPCSPGRSVSAGDVLGRVGNSGWTERPHVHMQAMRAADGDWWHGEPVPMTFQGRVLARNDGWRA